MQHPTCHPSAKRIMVRCNIIAATRKRARRKPQQLQQYVHATLNLDQHNSPTDDDSTQKGGRNARQRRDAFVRLLHPGWVPLFSVVRMNDALGNSCGHVRIKWSTSLDGDCLACTTYRLADDDVLLCCCCCFTRSCTWVRSHQASAGCGRMSCLEVSASRF